MFNLSIDTTNAETSVALSKDSKIIDFIVSDLANTQSKNLFKFIEEIFLKHNIGYADIAKIFLTTGPGSFTGIRVAIAAVQGIKLVTQIPVFGISNFQVIAYDSDVQNSFFVVLNARRNQFYIQKFLPNFITFAPELIEQEKILAMINNDDLIVCDQNTLALLGDAKNIISTKYSKFDARNVAISGEFFLNKNLTLATEPIYIRPADAKISEIIAPKFL